MDRYQFDLLLAPLIPELARLKIPGRDKFRCSEVKVASDDRDLQSDR